MTEWYDRLPKYSSNWAELSKACKKRDGYKCKRCGQPATAGNPLHAAHKRSKSHGGMDVLVNLETLCENCHANERGHAHLKRAVDKRKGIHKPPRQNTW